MFSASVRKSGILAGIEVIPNMSAKSLRTFLVTALLALPCLPGVATAQVETLPRSDALTPRTTTGRSSDLPSTRRDERGRGGASIDIPLGPLLDALRGPAEEPPPPPPAAPALPPALGSPSPAPPAPAAASSPLDASPAQPPVVTRRAGSGVPPVRERRFFPDEVVIELANGVLPQQIDSLEQRQRVVAIERRSSVLSGTTLLRARIADRRSVAAAVRALENDAVVISAQPNFRFALQQQSVARPPGNGGTLQYAPAKLRLPEAHQLATGGNVFVAVIDSGVDTSHAELDGAIAATFDTFPAPGEPHSHGTAIAGLIAAHAKLMGSAPAAHILAARAFEADGAGADGSTFNILKALDWAAISGARVINMSFAGPADPAIHRSLDAAHARGIVLVAAAGNAGAKSPPLYPGADPNVIAVTATDVDDKPFGAANRGAYIAVAAPGVDLLVAIPDGAYRISSGTSLAAAEVSGIAALMIERKPSLTPDDVRALLLATARPLGPSERTGAGLVDAYRAVSEQEPGPTALTGTR